jgi:hypothetical protein
MPIGHDLWYERVEEWKKISVATVFNSVDATCVSSSNTTIILPKNIYVKEV